MELIKAILNVLCFVLVDSLVVVKDSDNGDIKKDIDTEADIEDVFNGVYTECFVHLSYACIQNKTLMYLEELNKLSEVPIVGNYVKLVRLNTTKQETNEESHKGKSSKELSFMIDKAVDRFFDNHVVKFNVMGRNISVPTAVEEFVGRKKRKGGGGGGGGGHGGDDGGKKKMMMMAMMCMKMKLMMMVPAMMGMMGMMSFKGMMFSMMSFMISKMMLLMKLLEKKGGGGPGGGAAGDGGWAAASGGGGSWMPAGGQDFGGAGGGYDANAQWQSRTLLDSEKPQVIENPLVSFVPSTMRFSNKFVNDNKFDAVVKNRRVTTRLVKEENKPKSRKKRGIIDILQNSYLYWMNKFLGVNNNRRTQLKYPKFRIINGIKYVYHPYKMIPKVKSQEVVPHVKQLDDGFKPIITAEDFNKGEIVEGGVESRMIRKKFHKMKDSVNDTVDDNPWE